MVGNREGPASGTASDTPGSELKSLYERLEQPFLLADEGKRRPGSRTPSEARELREALFQFIYRPDQDDLLPE